MVGLSRFELLTPRLSSVCSNQLSYRPHVLERAAFTRTARSYSSPLSTAKQSFSIPFRAKLSKNRLSSTRAEGPILSKLDRRACQIGTVGCQIDLRDSLAGL